MTHTFSGYSNRLRAATDSDPIEAGRFVQAELANGLRIVTSRLTHTKAVSTMLLVGAGSRYETDEQAGVSHLFEHMLFKGTPSRPRPRDISGPIESVGGSINAFTDRELTGYWCKMALPHYRNGISVIADIIRNPLFRPDDIRHEKDVVLEEIRASHDYPQARAGMLLDAALWPEQPLGRDVAGSEETVKSLTREQMVDYHRHQYVPSNIVIAVAGNVEHKDVAEQIDDLLGDMHAGAALPKHPFVDRLEGPTFTCERRDLEQLHIAIAFQGVAMEDNRRQALMLMSVVLGGSMSSRLFEEVREKRGLAYGIGSSVHSLTDCGSIDIDTGVDLQRAEEAVKVIMDEVVKMREGISDEELHNARELAKGRFLLGMEESRAVASDLASQCLLKSEISTVEQRITELDDVTAEDVAAAADDVIRADKSAVSIVGPFENLDRIKAIWNFE